jgi:hypothetical protein
LVWDVASGVVAVGVMVGVGVAEAVGVYEGVAEGMKKVEVMVGEMVVVGVDVMVFVGKSAVGTGRVGVKTVITSVMNTVGVGDTVNLILAVSPTHRMIPPNK